jgi:type II secretory pathway pseudopilin PulG
MGNRTPLGRPGFLLVEILLVVLILAVGLAVVVRSFGSSLDALGTSANYTRALLLLEERLWELEAKGSIVPGTFSGGFSEEDGNFRWAVKASELPQIGLCETQVTVSWEQRGHPRAVSIVTYLKGE